MEPCINSFTCTKCKKPYYIFMDMKKIILSGVNTNLCPECDIEEKFEKINEQDLRRKENV